MSAVPLPAPAPAAIGGRLVICLGLSQLVGWGTMHYLIGVFGTPIARELGWSASFVQSGFSLALVVMGLVSAPVGRWINRRGGRFPMMLGCWIGAAGCLLLATLHAAAQYLVAWALLGLAMRLALYDAAFAALARLGGAASKRAMSQVTLFGGLASTVFWPLGHALAQGLGWRGALGAYALFLLGCSLLHRALPREAGGAAEADAPADAAAASAGAAAPAAATATDTGLYALIVVLTLAMQTGIAAHFIGLLHGFGWDAATAVTLSTLLGLGQLAGRSWVVASGHRIDAIRLNVLPCALLAAAFAVGLVAGTHLAGAAAFALLYGGGNGIATITRGAMPLRLFDPAQYGRIVGRLLRPAFLLSAAAPVALAATLEHVGQAGTLGVGLAASVALLVAAGVLTRRHPPPPAGPR